MSGYPRATSDELDHVTPLHVDWLVPDVPLAAQPATWQSCETCQLG